jgi:hypothetical protein
MEKGTLMLASFAVKTTIAIAAIISVLSNPKEEYQRAMTMTQQEAPPNVDTDLNRIVNEDTVKEMLLALTDNGGNTIDRYSAYFKDGSVMTFSSNPESPAGMSQWGEFLEGPDYTRETKLNFDTFDLKAHIIRRVRDGYRDYVRFCRESNANDAEVRKAILDTYKKQKA